MLASDCVYRLLSPLHAREARNMRPIREFAGLVLETALAGNPGDRGSGARFGVDKESPSDAGRPLAASGGEGGERAGRTGDGDEERREQGRDRRGGRGSGGAMWEGVCGRAAGRSVERRCDDRTEGNGLVDLPWASPGEPSGGVREASTDDVSSATAWAGNGPVASSADTGKPEYSGTHGSVASRTVAPDHSGGGQVTRRVGRLGGRRAAVEKPGVRGTGRGDEENSATALLEMARRESHRKHPRSMVDEVRVFRLGRGTRYSCSTLRRRFARGG